MPQRSSQAKPDSTPGYTPTRWRAVSTPGGALRYRVVLLNDGRYALTGGWVCRGRAGPIAGLAIGPS